eukprot:TRINITY_DN4097_c0_g1_i1.p1 TRINITY_DN4097_c0_g1~~TRINITY_DN4097_c0_g1_i1.p1  ORF type:complete len:380 (+),score=61.64 TRINITY_DN4097_c0_g1_i1:455-1594(+)
MRRKKTKDNSVFIVHGHDELAKTQCESFLQQIGYSPIILHKEASQGRTIIEKIEHYSNVGFGIVLYTPCDIGGKSEENAKLQYRARQNVVLEHGFLMGKIGRSNVVALVKGEIEKPNDISGVVYQDMDDQGAWKFKVSQEMKAAGYEVDMNKIKQLKESKPMKPYIFILTVFVAILCSGQVNTSKSSKVASNQLVKQKSVEQAVVLNHPDKIKTVEKSMPSKKNKEKGFWAKTFEPSVFWGAFSAIFTAAGILVALFLPTCQKYSRTQYILKILSEEVGVNLKVAKASLTAVIPPGQEVYMSRQEFMRHLKFEAWEEYKFKLADNNLSAYSKYNEAYRCLYTVKTLDKIDEKLRNQMYKDEVKSFIDKCKELNIAEQTQ